MVMKIAHLPVVPECFHLDVQLSIFIYYIRDRKMKRMRLYWLRKKHDQYKQSKNSHACKCT